MIQAYKLIHVLARVLTDTEIMVGDIFCPWYPLAVECWQTRSRYQQNIVYVPVCMSINVS